MGRAERQEAYKKKVNETAEFIIGKILTEYRRLKTLDYNKDKTEVDISKIALDYGTGLLKIMIKKTPQEKRMVEDVSRVIVQKLTKKA